MMPTSKYMLSLPQVHLDSKSRAFMQKLDLPPCA